MVISDATSLKQMEQDALWVAQMRVENPDKTVLWLANKTDVSQGHGEVDIRISALTGFGIETLKQSLVDCIKQDFDVAQETIVSNVRHLEALHQTQLSLGAAKVGLEQQLPADLVAMDIRAAMRSLGNITGEIELDTDILGTIFSRFCIGK